ncbi:fimbrial protein [Chimaeribacter arupi]|uniref:Fimbrial protein n=2 Tax=Chimaeribacter arupi TaxID=2060066 RepID=A0A2N5EQ98_9GAMM|nr:fimbrial protein [Chimaeribacter arupi]MDV5139615.1 fimbrial protein [Chimaeribacter arupi]PLR38201.1 fimbrial protein [Chimaeribacter arupi]PLR51773.1 fimbrial protein [Chimaeribacter arupi]PLR54241.1 fimbrial protein [Chimaeribacter arupi]WKZ91382.1 fimbrial protein [Chimaeribacter arupi]
MKKHMLAVSALALALGASSAYADNAVGLITFDGAVTDTTCKITTNNGVEANNVTISLPVVQKADVKGASLDTRGVGAKEFELKLTECPAGAYEKASVTFTSQQFAELSNGTLKPDPTVAGAAQNVSLALFNNTSADQTQIKIGDMNATQVADISSGEGSLAFMVSYVPSADYNETTNDIVAGKVSSNTTFTMSYE